MIFYYQGAEHCGKKRRKRRDTEQTIILPDDGRSAIYAYNPDQPNFKIDEFPTPKGTTLVQAQSKCEDALRNSEIGKVCLKTIVGFNITDLVDQCVVDIQVRRFVYFGNVSISWKLVLLIECFTYYIPVIGPNEKLGSVTPGPFWGQTHAIHTCFKVVFLCSKEPHYNSKILDNFFFLMFPINSLRHLKKIVLFAFS